MLAVVVLWQGVIRPSSVGAGSRAEAYRAGLRTTAALYVGVVAILALAALYEAVASIYLVPALGIPPAG